MGTAAMQGPLWGARARTWADCQEPAWTEIYDIVLSNNRVGPGTRLLDVGCGAGGALVRAQMLGASVTGLDASKELAAIARERLPDARIEVGEMEELPFDRACFDVVTSFNAFQFAASTLGALCEACGVCAEQGRVVMLVWGAREHCDVLGIARSAFLSLLPKRPHNSGPVYSKPGVIEDLMQEAGLQACDGGEVTANFIYADHEEAWSALSSAAPGVLAIRAVGEATARRALSAALERFRDPNGQIVLRNRFRWVTGTPAKVAGT